MLVVMMLVVVMLAVGVAARHLHDPRLRNAALGHLGEGDRDVALQLRIARAREADERVPR